MSQPPEDSSRLERIRDSRWWPLGVFAVAFAGLILQRQLMESTWIPRGADWDTWYQSVLAITHDVPYPPNRWPLYSTLAAFFSLIIPGPVHVNAQVFSLGLTAGAVAGVFVLGRALLGLPGALVAAVLAASMPVVVELGTWISCYPLWATGAVWVVAGAVEAHRTERPVWWWVSGAALGAVLASQEKGIGIGLLVGGIVVASTLLRWRVAHKNLARLGAPVLLLGALYAVFPSPLMTLDAQIQTMESVYDSAPRQGPQVIADVDHSEYFEGGYIFGRSSAPWTIYRSLTKARGLTAEQTRSKRLRRSADILKTAFPRTSTNTLWWLAIGGLVGLLSGLVALVRRKGAAALVGWVGILGTVAGVLPSLFSSLSLRFLLPGLVMAPLLLVAPLALVTRRWSVVRWSPLLLLPVALLPVSPWAGSPWLQRTENLAWMEALLQPGDDAVSNWYALRRDLPDATIHVFTPPSAGLLVLDGREGSFLSPDPRFHGPLEWDIADSDYVLQWIEGPIGSTSNDPPMGGPPAVSAPMPPDGGAPGGREEALMQGREVIERWPQRQPGASLLLLGPVLQGLTGEAGGLP
ncbi:MAG: hypothetical protein ACI8RZ_002022 [Myxococcota bacterium]|jgi:hypothetical protein